MASFGSTTRPRAFTSKSSAFHDCSLSRKPSAMAISSFRPSAVAPISTRMHCRSSSRRMLKCTPSAHRYTYCLPSKDRFVPLLEFVFPTGLQPRDVVADRPRAVRPHQRRQGLAEVARADALQVQPGNQLLQALRLSQVRRQNLGGKGLGFAGRPSIEHARLLDLDRADAGE